MTGPVRLMRGGVGWLHYKLIIDIHLVVTARAAGFRILHSQIYQLLFNVGSLSTAWPQQRTEPSKNEPCNRWPCGCIGISETLDGFKKYPEFYEQIREPCFDAMHQSNVEATSTGLEASSDCRVCGRGGLKRISTSSVRLPIRDVISCNCFLSDWDAPTRTKNYFAETS